MYLFSLFTWALAVEAPLNISEDGTICYGLSDTSFSGPLVIPEGVKIIWKDSFFSNTRLTSLELPESLEEIQENAFYGCTALAGSLVIPNSVTEIGQYAFASCRGLTEVHVGRQITKIPLCAFLGCSLLKECYFYNSDVTISPNAFSQCPQLQCFYEVKECKGFTIDPTAFNRSPMSAKFLCLIPPTPPPTPLFTEVMFAYNSHINTLQLAFVLLSFY